MNSDTHICAVCSVHIKPGLLMCAKHWRLVPKGQQRAVLVTYGHWQRHKGSAADALLLIKTYREARDAAVASAREAVAQQATAGDLL